MACIFVLYIKYNGIYELNVTSFHASVPNLLVTLKFTVDRRAYLPGKGAATLPAPRNKERSEQS